MCPLTPPKSSPPPTPRVGITDSLIVMALSRVLQSQPQPGTLILLFPSILSMNPNLLITNLDIFMIYRVFVRVDVSARNPGKVQAALTENRRGLNELGLEPLREEQYYESNVTDDWIYDGGDVLDAQTNPEEIRKAQEEMRNQGFPSLANLMPGGGRSNEVSVWTHK
ncbi:hypothetical protein E3N88_24712 [Mikania micrantha]|uniref:Uncharacterized protein n=1 Tax=Mikania micrantha TaxID=192012 RepID=A0A5N6N2Z2_9ASTR|nr:hypothetical protein E3N88_24712 [Mikania micrantha]